MSTVVKKAGFPITLEARLLRATLAQHARSNELDRGRAVGEQRIVEAFVRVGVALLRLPAAAQIVNGSFAQQVG